MPIFEESGLTFRFDEKDWEIKKFDSHRFYKTLSGSGLKGVDFIGIYRNEKLVLIEVKNYVDRFFQDDIDPSENFIKSFPDFVPIITQKFTNSIKVIQIIHKYYLRKSWFRFLQRWVSLKFNFWKKLSWDWLFWNKSINFLQNSNNVELVLILETKPEFESKKALIKLIKKELNLFNLNHHIFVQSLEEFQILY